jgi:aminoglycoside phosphotransferase (APT) family kinase protein
MADVAGINAASVAQFFREHVPGGDGALHFSLISGGRSNLTYLVRGNGREWVLRRPPLGHVLPTAHDMAREYRVLAALADSAVPVARPIALCEDPAVNDMPFYVMEYRPGVVLAQSLPPGFADAEATRRAISEAMIGTLVQLHAIDYRAVGLEGSAIPTAIWNDRCGAGHSSGSVPRRGSWRRSTCWQAGCAPPCPPHRRRPSCTATFASAISPSIRRTPPGW